MVYGIVVAGGIGSRMGGETPKQFMLLKGKPIIIYSIETFLASAAIDSVIVLTPAEWVEYAKQLIREHCKEAVAKSIQVLPGGSIRNETIMNAIRFIDEAGNLDDNTVIVTHDAVRPLVTDRMIRDNIEAVRECGAAATVINATDTIICSGDGNKVDTVPDRTTMFQAQTPQSFYAKELAAVYQTLTDEDKNALTDATKIYVLKGKTVKLVQGERYNIKITYPQDIATAEALMGSIK